MASLSSPLRHLYTKAIDTQRNRSFKCPINKKIKTQQSRNFIQIVAGKVRFFYYWALVTKKIYKMSAKIVSNLNVLEVHS